MSSVKGVWQPDDDVTACNSCAKPFTLLTRRHHCRICGLVFCGTCSCNRILLKSFQPNPVRVCQACIGDELKTLQNQPDDGLLRRRLPSVEQCTAGDPLTTQEAQELLQELLGCQIEIDRFGALKLDFRNGTGLTPKTHLNPSILDPLRVLMSRLQKHRNPHVLVYVSRQDPTALQHLSVLQTQQPDLWAWVPGLEALEDHTLVAKNCSKPEACAHGCAYPDGPTAKLVAFSAVICGGKLLVVKDRHRSFWGLPGGAHNRGEDIARCAVRELREETGFLTPTGTFLQPTDAMGLLSCRQFTREKIVSGTPQDDPATVKVDTRRLVDIAMVFIFRVEGKAEDCQLTPDPVEVENAWFVSEQDLEDERVRLDKEAEVAERKASEHKDPTGSSEQSDKKAKEAKRAAKKIDELLALLRVDNSTVQASLPCSRPGEEWTGTTRKC